MEINKKELREIVDKVFEDEMIKDCIKYDDPKIEYSNEEIMENFNENQAMCDIVINNGLLSPECIETYYMDYINYKFESIEKDLSRETTLYIDTVINIAIIDKYEKNLTTNLF